MRFSNFYMDTHVFGTINYHKITRRIIKSVFVYMMNVLRRFKFAVQKTFHNYSMFGFIVAFTGINIPVSIFNITKSKYSFANRFTVSFHKMIMVVTQSFCICRQITTTYLTNFIRMTIRFFYFRWITIFIPTFIMRSTHFTRFNIDGIITVFYTAFLIHDSNITTMGNDVKKKMQGETI